MQKLKSPGPMELAAVADFYSQMFGSCELNSNINAQHLISSCNDRSLRLPAQGEGTVPWERSLCLTHDLYAIARLHMILKIAKSQS